MQAIGGNDDFRGTFDVFEWSAPYYETPQEIVEALNSMDIAGKRVAGIYVVGHVGKVGQTHGGILYRRILEAGIEPDERWWETYPHLDGVLLPWEATACEPLQFVFDDGSTLEILPTAWGGARVGRNTVPAGLTEGLNHPDFDANSFFAEAIGKTMDYVRVCIDTKSHQSILPGRGDCRKPYVEKRTEYTIQIKFKSMEEIGLTWNSECRYRIEMHNHQYDRQIPYARVKASEKTRRQVTIINGTDHGGVFRISPVKRENEKEKKRLFVHAATSIDEYDVYNYLRTFLLRYFDPEIQKKSDYAYENGERRFDWYGGNLYTYDSMRKMLAEIRRTAELLETDYDDPRLAEVKKGLKWHEYTSRRKDELSEAEKDEVRKNDVPVAVDFYRRFVKRMEAVMRLPGYDVMSFAGP